MRVFARLAPVSVVSVTAIGLVAPVVLAPPAAAAPCAQTAAAAAPDRIQPLPGAAMPPVEHVPTGRMPRGAQNQAVPSRLGPLPAALDPAAPGALNFAPMQQEGAVLPWPVPGPPGPAGQQVPNLTGPTTGAPAAAIAAPTTTIVNWVDGPNSPNNTYTRFAISGADLGIMWDNGQTGANHQVLIAFGDTFGDCSVPDQQWRSNTMFRSGDPNLSDGIQVPIPTFGDLYAGRVRHFHGRTSPSRSSTVRRSRNRGDDHSDRRDLRRDNAVRQLHVRQAVGQSGPLDDELLGNRRFHRQRRKLDGQPCDRPRR